MHSPTIPFRLVSTQREEQLAQFNARKEIAWFGFRGAFKEPGLAIINFTNLAFREVEEPPQSMAALSPQVLMQPSCLPVWVTTIPRSSSPWSCRSNFCPLHLSTSRLHSKRMWFDLLKTSRSPRAFSIRQVQCQPSIWQLPPLWWRLRARHAAGRRKAQVSVPSAEMEIFDDRSPKARAF